MDSHAYEIQESSKITKEDQSIKKSHWSLLRNVVKAISLFKTHDTNRADDINDLINDIKKIPTDKAYQMKKSRSRENSAYYNALRDMRREENLLKCVERGNPDDLLQIQMEIDTDPYKLLSKNNHPFALINKRNRDGHTPLYIACKNGNLEVVLLLLKEKVDYLITSKLDNEEENNLEVAIRWGHTKIAEELLKLK